MGNEQPRLASSPPFSSSEDKTRPPHSDSSKSRPAVGQLQPASLASNHRREALISSHLVSARLPGLSLPRTGLTTECAYPEPIRNSRQVCCSCSGRGCYGTRYQRVLPFGVLDYVAWLPSTNTILRSGHSTGSEEMRWLGLEQVSTGEAAR